MLRPFLLALAQSGLASNVGEVHCLNVTKSNFNPACLPDAIRNYSDLGVQEPPYQYLQWQLAETCGLPLAALAAEFATLPEIISRGLRGVFMIWSLYIMGNFLAVGVLSLFQVAPVKRRCWGFFRENSFDYKRFVGPLYWVLFGLAILIAGGITCRFFADLHGFRKLLKVLKETEELRGPLNGTVPSTSPSRGCFYIMALRWMGYRHCFDLLLLMVFTSVDLVMLAAELGWMCILQCLAYCRCFFCSFWKGCCGICGYLCCTSISALCCFVPLMGILLYLLIGLVAVAAVGMLTLMLLAAVLLSFTWALRYILSWLTCHFCIPLRAASWSDMALLLYPFPPGSPGFATAYAVRRPMNEEEEDEDMEIRKVPAVALEHGFDVQQSTLSSNYTIWEKHLGLPYSWMSYAFPAWWSVTFAPALLMALAVAAQLSSNSILFSEAMADSDLDWLPTTPLSTWSYHWCVLKAVCGGITDAFHGVFVEVPLHLFRAPKTTWVRFSGFSYSGTDFLNLFSADKHASGTLVEGQFHGNFHNFRATVMLLRLLLTMLFASLRLTAVIARTPSADSGEEDSWDEEICP